jgi:hypothetical protein
MTPDVDAQLRRIEDALDSGDERRILAAVSEFIAIDEAAAPVRAWAGLLHRSEPYLFRVISYTLAKAAGSQSGFLWGPLAAFVATPTQDAATMTNISSAIQIYDEHDEILTAVLAPHFGAFTLRGLGAVRIVADAICDLLIHLADRGALQRLLTRTQADDIAESLTANPDSVDDIGALLGILQETQFPEIVPDATNILTRYEASVSDAAESLGEQVATSLLSVLANARSSYELRRQTEELNAVGEEVRLEGSDAAKGRLGVETFERLIHSWKAAIREGIASLNPLAADNATTFVLAQTRGSFVLRFLVQSSEPDLVTRSFEQLATLTQRPEELASEATLTPEGRTQLFHFLDALAQKGLDATISITDAQTFTTPKQRLTAGTLNSQLRKLRQRKKETSIPQRVVTGVLEAANHRQGTFEVIADDSEQIRGDMPANRRPLLLQKVIGRRYRFTLKETITSGAPGDEKRHVTLISIDSIDGVLIAEPEIIETEPKTLSSGDVPQQDRLDRIVQVIRVIASGAELEPKQLAMANTSSSLRHLDYMRHGAKVLGLLTEDGTLTSAGSTLAQLPDSRVLDFLSVQFELSTVGKLWKKWSRATDLHGLDPDSAPRFLRQHGLSDSMAERRGRTLRKWLQKFKSQSKFQEPGDDTD